MTDLSPSRLSHDLTDLGAGVLSAVIHARQVSCVEVMQAYLQRIHRLNPACTAIVNLADADALLAQARACDDELARGHSRGWMHGIPQAIKDTGAAAGFPTTFGSPLLKDAVAAHDGVMTARMKAAGCIVIGKTNMPEFGLGSHTFNELFGATRNAWDPAVSAGGSSGGAAVALAHRLLPVADGSDFMGSLRNPAAWNHIYGLRPSQGRVPLGPGADVWVDQLATEGPMARNVDDLGRLLATQAGHDPRLPLSLDDGYTWASPGPREEGLRGLRVAWLGDLQGHLATEPGVLDACETALARMRDAGAVIEPVAPGFSPEEIWECWLVWRRALTGPRVGALLALPGARERIKPEALWEYDHAQSLSYTEFARASQTRTRFYHHLLQMMGRYDVIALPAAQVWPFPVAQRWPQVIGSRTMDPYPRWLECTLSATLAGLPGISVPAGFHPTQPWPMGLQLIGPARGDAFLLRVAAAYELVLGEVGQRRPA